jgi:type IV secretory pathway TrbD component
MLYRATIHQSLTRPMLLAGAERAPALANWIMAAGILFSGSLHWYTIAICALLVTIAHWVLTQAAKFDPQLSRVYLQHVRYHRNTVRPARRRAKSADASLSR